MIEIKTFCPLGLECETAIDGKIRRCRWYKHMEGMDHEGKEIDLYDCAIAWIPRLLVQNSQMSNRTRSATEDLRNHVVEGNQVLQKAIAERENARLPRQ